MPTLVLTTRIAAPVAECFTRSLSVEAHSASMAHSDERAVGAITEGVLGPGQSVTWRARHFGVPFTMTSRISAYDAPHRFVDEQVRGPFRRWWHEHRFQPVVGGTLMTDTVEFAAPAGPVGRLVERWVLTAYMTALLERRNAWLRADLEA